jgi:hypothetical protein
MAMVMAMANGPWRLHQSPHFNRRQLCFIAQSPRASLLSIVDSKGDGRARVQRGPVRACEVERGRAGQSDARAGCALYDWQRRASRAGSGQWAVGNG